MRCVERCELDVADIVLEPLASADAVLSEDEKEIGVAVTHGGDDGSGCELNRLGDEQQRVLVVLVDHDDGQVRVLARDQLGRFAHGDRERHDLVTQLLERGPQHLEGVLVLVGDQDAQIRFHRRRLHG